MIRRVRERELFENAARIFFGTRWAETLVPRGLPLSYSKTFLLPLVMPSEYRPERFCICASRLYGTHVRDPDML